MTPELKKYMDEQMERFHQMSRAERLKHIDRAIAYCNRHNLFTPEERELLSKPENADLMMAKCCNRMALHQYSQRQEQ